MSEFATIIDREYEPLTISKADVERSTDVSLLTDWFVTLHDQAGHVSEFLRAYREAELEDDDYCERSAGKLAFLRIAARWVEHRLIMLGVQPPYPPSDPRSRQLRVLQEKVEKLTARLGKLEATA